MAIALEAGKAQRALLATLKCSCGVGAKPSSVSCLMERCLGLLPLGATLGVRNANCSWWVQLGQFFAARAEFVPEPICRKLSLLHDRVGAC